MNSIAAPIVFLIQKAVIPFTISFSTLPKLLFPVCQSKSLCIQIIAEFNWGFKTYIQAEPVFLFPSPKLANLRISTEWQAGTLDSSSILISFSIKVGSSFWKETDLPPRYHQFQLPVKEKSRLLLQFTQTAGSQHRLNSQASSVQSLPSDPEVSVGKPQITVLRLLDYGYLKPTLVRVCICFKCIWANTTIMPPSRAMEMLPVTGENCPYGE